MSTRLFPFRLRAHWLMLAVVTLLIGAATAWPAADALRPVRSVHVSAVLPGAVTLSADAALSDVPAARRTVQAPGWIEPDPFPTAVTALADGVVARVLVLAGQSVEAGQVVAELVRDDAELAARRSAALLAAARAEAASANATLVAAQTDWDQPVERDRRVAVSAAMRDEAQAALARHPDRVRVAEAELARWREELELLDGARDRGAATERERIVAQYRVAALAAGLDALRAERPELQARVDRHAAEADAAVRDAVLRVDEKRTLDGARAERARREAEVAAAAAAHDEARLRLDRMTLRAPMAGNVLRRLRGPGDKVMLAMDDPHSSHLLHLYDPASLQVRVDVPLADAAQVGVGQACEVVVDVLPDQTFAGEVTRVTHEADLQKNTLEIKVRVLDPSPLLKPEMLARVKFLGNAGGGAAGKGGAAASEPLRVSQACLDADGARVWAVRDRRGPRGSAVPVTVRVLGIDDGVATVRAALHVGDLLVQRPAGLVDDTPVRIRPAGTRATPAAKGGDA